MDEHRHKILETLVFFMTISQIKKTETLSSFTNKHKKLEQKEKNEKR
jgi:hypothetical protein